MPFIYASLSLMHASMLSNVPPRCVFIFPIILIRTHQLQLPRRRQHNSKGSFFPSIVVNHRLQLLRHSAKSFETHASLFFEALLAYSQSKLSCCESMLAFCRCWACIWADVCVFNHYFVVQTEPTSSYDLRCHWCYSNGAFIFSTGLYHRPSSKTNA